MARRITLIILISLICIISGCKETDIERNLIDEDNNAESINSDDIESKVLRITSPSDISTLNSTIATDIVSFEVLGNTMEGLFVLTGGNKLKNGVCESYIISKDGKTYTFKLIKDSVWTNGEPVTAHDFVYAWRRLGNPKTDYGYTKRPPQISFMLEIAGIKNSREVIMGEKPIKELGVYAKDEYTLVVELENPIPYLPNILSFPSFLPLNESFVEEKGENFGTTIESTLFNGPYILHSWDQEKEFVYKKNENYWNKDVIEINEVVATVVKDVNVALDLYNSQSIDVVNASKTHLLKYYDIENLALKPDSNDDSIIITPSDAVWYLELYQQNELLQNTSFRKAIAFSIEKEYVTNQIVDKEVIPSDYLVPKNLILGSDGKDYRGENQGYNHYNPEKAKAYWEKAKRELDIETTTIVLLVYDTEELEKIAENIQEQLQSNLQGLKLDIAYERFYGGPRAFKLNGESRTDMSIINMQLSGWGPDYLDPMTYLDMWTTDSNHNFFEYSNSEFDSIIQRAKTGDLALNPEKRFSELKKAEKILLDEDVAIIPLYQRGETILIKNYIKNWQINSFAPGRYWGTMDIVTEGK